MKKKKNRVALAQVIKNEGEFVRIRKDKGAPEPYAVTVQDTDFCSTVYLTKREVLELAAGMLNVVTGE